MNFYQYCSENVCTVYIYKHLKSQASNLTIVMHNLVFYICTFSKRLLHQKLSKSPIELCALITKIKLVIIDIYFPIEWFRFALKIQIFQKLRHWLNLPYPPVSPYGFIHLKVFFIQKKFSKALPHTSPLSEVLNFSYF